MITSNSRIFLAITLSLLLFFGLKYLYTNPQILRPENILAAVNQKTAEIKTKISSIKIPNLSNFKNFLTFKLSFPSNDIPLKQYNNNNSNSFSLPTVPPIQPTLTDSTDSDRFNRSQPTPTIKPSPTRTPTAVPRPTATPRPTAVPRPTTPSVPTPTVENPFPLARPQDNLNEVVSYASIKTCVPPPLFKAITMIESGDRLFTMSQSDFLFYNTYNWWNDPGLTFQKNCFGLNYNSYGGRVPLDSKYAGQQCITKWADKYDIKSMGFLQLSEDEYNAYKTRINNILKQETTDRRVILDSYINLGLHLKNISTERTENCSSWEKKYVIKAACKYHGSCYFSGDDYCTTACNYYNQYGGSINCSNLPGIISDDGKCTFK